MIQMPSLHFREDKATQVAAKLLQLGGGRMNLMKLVKLVYLADREALVRYSRPITMDDLCSLEHGPIVSNTLNLINAEPDPENPRYWHQFISERRADYEVRLLKEPATDQLSRVEEEVIGDVYKKYGHMDKWAIRNFTHTLPEWHDPRGSMLPIRIRDILIAVGRTEQEAEEVEAELQYASRVRYDLQ